MEDLKNRTIIITGAAGLLGSAFASGFSKRKSTLVLLDSSDKVKNFEHTLMQQECKVLTYVGDLSKKNIWKDIERDLYSKEIRPDVLINNACLKTSNFFDPFEDFSLEDWNQVFDVNLTACMLGCQVFGANFAKQNRGSIISIASIYGIVAPDQRIYEGSEYLGKSINTPAVYSASKAGLIGLTKYLSTYWGNCNVRANCVTPGGVFSGQNGAFVDKYSAKVPLKRMANPEDIFGAVAFLASDISSYMTGQNLIVDGGWTAW
jgi:NAD(P)-dependent dehydrogenase (short-subunit alcohol dehydrogenase family)